MDVIGQVCEGMRALDVNGTDVGTVEEVRMGDPQAVTEEGQEPYEEARPTLGEAFFVGDEPYVPPQLLARLVRMGYVVDAKGLLAGDLYAAADRIDRVEGDTVPLSVGKDDLVSQS